MDAYTRRARLYPTLLAALPLSVFAIAVFPSVPGWWPKFAALFSASGFPVLVGQLGRSAGKRKEAALFEAWGGAPTTALLRHSSRRNPFLVQRDHENLSSLLQKPFPTAEQEAQAPHDADALYETAVRLLRERTRDRKRFPLVFEEVANYGFRRNLWGLRQLGLWATVLSLAAAGVTLILMVTNALAVPAAPFLAVILLDILGLVLWLRVVSPDWVKESAFSYAEQLLASTEQTCPA
jgi:hypothetical protein